jgi:PAS domain S-box-containing protein
VTAVEQSSEGIVITDVDTRILYVNRAFESLHAVDRQEVLRQNYEDILRVDRRTRHFEKGFMKL